LKTKIFYIAVCILLVSGCDLLNKKNSRNAIARVNEHILFEDELSENLPPNLSKEDSISFAKSFIEEWAKDKIILDRAKFNLPQKEQERYDLMVKEYRSQLFKKAYMSALVQKEIEESIDSSMVADYYDNNKELFRINEHLLKLRYLYIRKDLNDFSKIKDSFKRFNFEDQIYLDNQKLKFDKAKLNDSIWVKSLTVFRDLKDLTKEQHNRLFYKNRYIEIEDSSSTYIIYVKDVLKPNSIAPINYIKPTIEQILKNKKELKLRSELEKQILTDAIKNNDYEIFE
jgi:hypothetical protein